MMHKFLETLIQENRRFSVYAAFKCQGHFNRRDWVSFFKLIRRKFTLKCKHLVFGKFKGLEINATLTSQVFKWLYSGF